MAMTGTETVLWLERLGYTFSLEGDKAFIRYQGKGDPPVTDSDLSSLLRPHREVIRRALRYRAEGFSLAADGVLFAYGDDILPMARKIKTALDKGDLWDVRVIYSRSKDRAEFRFQPPEWDDDQQPSQTAQKRLPPLFQYAIMRTYILICRRRSGMEELIFQLQATPENLDVQWELMRRNRGLFYHIAIRYRGMLERCPSVDLEDLARIFCKN